MNIKKLDKNQIEIINKDYVFYISKEKSVWNQYPKPFLNDEEITSTDKNNYFDEFYRPLIDNFKKIYLPSKDVLEIIETYGYPFYIKIDVERYDHEILKRLLINNNKNNI